MTKILVITGMWESDLTGESILWECVSGWDINQECKHSSHNWYLFIPFCAVWTLGPSLQSNLPRRIFSGDENCSHCVHLVFTLCRLQDILEEAESTVRKRAWNSHFSGGIGGWKLRGQWRKGVFTVNRKKRMEQSFPRRAGQETLE